MKAKKEIKIRRDGGSFIIAIPTVIANTYGIKKDDKLILTAVGNRIILTVPTKKDGQNGTI